MARLPLLFAFALLALTTRAQSFLPPEPVGGPNAVRWMLEQEMVFPEEALNASTEGNVDLRFLVLSDGSITDLHVVRSLRPDCDAEAMRLARLVRWYPASVGGSPMDQQQDLTIPFSAKKYRKALDRKDRCARFMTNTADPSGRIYKDREVDTLATPQVPKGLKGLPAYLAGNLRYPPEAFRRDIQGQVTIEFIVEPSGSLSNLRATEALGAGCDDEALRLVRSICWRPATANGQHVRCAMKLAIQFRLDPSKRP